jgi:hypothetical protein
MPTDWPAISEPRSTSPSITARRSAPAQKCSISSCAGGPCRPRPHRAACATSRCLAVKASVPAFLSARTGITGRRGSSLDAGDGVAGRGADEGLLERRMRDASVAQAKRVPSCTPPRPSRDRTRSPRRGRCRPPRTPAPRCQFRQDFLRQHRGRDRADMAARFHALDHQRIGAGTHQLLRQRQRGAKQITFAPLALIASIAALGRQCRRPARYG